MVFDLDTWRNELERRVRRFVRNPHQEVALFGAERLVDYVAALVFEPFFQAYATQPLRAAVALSQLTQAEGTTFLLHNATSLRYNQQRLWTELHQSAALRVATEQVLLKLDVLDRVLHTLEAAAVPWFRDTLGDEIEVYRQQGEWTDLRHALYEMPWQNRYTALQALGAQAGNYSAADMKLLRLSLRDKTSVVRSTAARQLGRLKNVLPQDLREPLFELALYDRDVGTRYAAARALGMLRDQLVDATSREILTTALFHDDSFVRSAASIVLGQVGATLASPTILDSLLIVLRDDDAYAREAAATALGSMGVAAATSEIMAALTVTLLDADQYVHEAALTALRVLQPLQPQGGSTALT